MKKKYAIIALATAAVVLIVLAVFRWDARYGGQNAIEIEKAKVSIRQGRGYEVLVENKVYLTDDVHFSDMMHFLEGHYGMRLMEFDEETAVFAGDYGETTFRLIEIVSFGRQYKIWEREN